jgi:hypothetical protein
MKDDVKFCGGLSRFGIEDRDYRPPVASMSEQIARLRQTGPAPARDVRIVPGCDLLPPVLRFIERQEYPVSVKYIVVSLFQTTDKLLSRRIGSLLSWHAKKHGGLSWKNAGTKWDRHWYIDADKQPAAKATRRPISPDQFAEIMAVLARIEADLAYLKSQTPRF